MLERKRHPWLEILFNNYSKRLDEITMKSSTDESSHLFPLYVWNSLRFFCMQERAIKLASAIIEVRSKTNTFRIWFGWIKIFDPGRRFNHDKRPANEQFKNGFC